MRLLIGLVLWVRQWEGLKKGKEMGNNRLKQSEHTFLVKFTALRGCSDATKHLQQ